MEMLRRLRKDKGKNIERDSKRKRASSYCSWQTAAEQLTHYWQLFVQLTLTQYILGDHFISLFTLLYTRHAVWLLQIQTGNELKKKAKHKVP